mmetsp:Transcript_21065/g.33972  ORF Transcript_21065/g.33972 Transcript_21065/m.33972 type:complete len:131 (+) Transcript_21065:877-1269(+)
MWSGMVSQKVFRVLLSSALSSTCTTGRKRWNCVGTAFLEISDGQKEELQAGEEADAVVEVQKMRHLQVIGTSKCSHFFQQAGFWRYMLDDSRVICFRMLWTPPHLEKIAHRPHQRCRELSLATNLKSSPP